MAKVLKRSKKTRRNISEGVISILAGFNNTHITISDTEGNVLTWATGGKAGFRGARESTPYAAQVAAEQAIEQAQTYHGLEKIKIYVKGIGSGREQAIRGIIASGVEITNIFDMTPIPHNGCRKKKVRKL